MEENGVPPHELDVVKFRESVGHWPPGTQGTVVNAFREAGLVEIVDEGGGTLDLIVVPYYKLNVVWAVDREHVH
jgi:hypothetical protein